MRDFFILWLERIINLVIILGALVVLVAGFAVMFSPGGGFLQGLATWAFGSVYLILMGGMIHLALGIHNNTRRTADAVEALTRR